MNYDRKSTAYYTNIYYQFNNRELHLNSFDQSFMRTTRTAL